MVKYISLILSIILFSVKTTLSINPPLETRVYDEYIRSLQVRTTDKPEGVIGVPVLAMNSPEGIIIEFDRLTEDRDYMRYSLTHCDREWRPDALIALEYLDGFNEGTIEDYELSQGTSVHYVHYRLVIPNNEVRPTISGNYVVKIYPENNPDEVWVTVRFCLCENTAAIGGTWSGRTDIDYNHGHQQLELRANVEQAHVRDYFNDLALVIEQNGIPSTSRTLTKPMRISASSLIYEHQPELIFEGSNEYRRFETVSKNYNPMGVENIEYAAPYYRYRLYVDTPRSAQSYIYDQTLSGGYIVRNADNVTPDPLVSSVESDYGIVYYELEMPQMPMQDIYIVSDATQFRIDDTSKMIYDNETGRYTKAMLLKQGAYSYQYIARDQRTGRISTSITEGNHYETSNQYDMRLYHRIPGERYDRLIGASSFKTTNF
ncbi:MAG: DUF5103 domain-containing protein [Muribaculaceae bacterium]|nr:DUF5103 domain-containing protein [Muribaculaceae bacterium]